MTKNQIEYLKVREQQRANVANEDLTRQRDTLAHQRGLIELRESGRHNRATEGLTGAQLDIQRGSLDETSRHNRTTEGQQQAQLVELNRHNLASEALQRGQLSETSRHNVAVEGETVRHNQASESATLIDLQEKNRHNVATETESKRHNIASEITDAGRLAVSEQQALETNRHNLVMETKDYAPSIVNLNGSTSNTDQGSSFDDLAKINRYARLRLYESRNGTLTAQLTGVDNDSGSYPVEGEATGSPYITLRNGEKLYLGRSIYNAWKEESK